MSNIVYLSLGTNLGDRLSNLIESIRKLKDLSGFGIIDSSSIFETEPVGNVDQNMFYNMVLKAYYDDTPDILLEQIQLIEDEMGRTRDVHWGPRSIDIDILFFGDMVVKTDDLELPHRELKNRKFVLTPLIELDSDLEYPETGEPIKDIYEDCQDKSQIIKIETDISSKMYN